MSNPRWEAADDRRLESLRSSTSVKQLAALFGRGEGAIRARLKHLDDPEHSAYQRLRGVAPVQAPKRSFAEFAPPPVAETAAGGSTRVVPWSSVITSSAATAGIPLPVVDESSLLPSQLEAVNATTSGRNIFLTGPAGTGKSFVTRVIIQNAQRCFPADGAVAITASTGIAAQHIGGQTIHSFAGVGLARNNKETLYEKLSDAARIRWTRVRLLVLDEVSMIDSSLMDKLEFIARQVKDTSKPWGGVQLVFVGDFFQLPPVGLGKFGQKFAFQSLAWAAAGVQKQVLREIVRQSTDTRFANLLNEIRVGKCSASTLSTLASCHESVKRMPRDGIEPTRIHCKNAEVDEENLQMLDQLPGAEVVVAAHDTWLVDPGPDSDGRRFAERAMEVKAVTLLRLKVDAQVMLCKNIPERGLSNGSRGVVTGFSGESPVVRFDNGAVLVLERNESFAGNCDGCFKRLQYPLKLAWAVTVHKSQGMTLSRASIQIGDAFEVGQVYVALSRVSSLDGLFLVGGMLHPSGVKAHKDVVDYYSTAY